MLRIINLEDSESSLKKAPAADLQRSVWTLCHTAPRLGTTRRLIFGTAAVRQLVSPQVFRMKEWRERLSPCVRRTQRAYSAGVGDGWNVFLIKVGTRWIQFACCYQWLPGLRNRKEEAGEKEKSFKNTKGVQRLMECKRKGGGVVWRRKTLKGRRQKTLGS